MTNVVDIRSRRQPAKRSMVITKDGFVTIACQQCDQPVFPATIGWGYRLLDGAMLDRQQATNAAKSRSAYVYLPSPGKPARARIFDVRDSVHDLIVLAEHSCPVVTE